MVDILVVGATGFTGRLITRYLYNHPQRSSFTLGVGVRSKAKGEELKRSLGLDDRVQLIQLDVSSYETVEPAVKDAKVVINAVGPFWRYGANVVRACAVHGKRYVDLTGEPHFVRKIADLYDYLATKTGAIIVPACGMDSVPGDIAVYLSNQTLKKKLGPQTDLGLSETFYTLRVAPSGGSFATLLSLYEEVPRLKVQEAHRDYALSPIPGAPSPPFRLATRVPFRTPVKYGAPYVMGLSNRAIVQRTFGLNQMALSAAHVFFGEKEASEKEEQIRPYAYGTQFRYAEYLVSNGGTYLSAVIASTFMGLMFSLLYFAPIRWLFKKLVFKPGEGPTEQVMEKGFMVATNYTATASEPATWAKTVFRGQGDPGYLLSSIMISECALGLLLDDDKLPVTARPGGILTPATALGDVIVRRLQATGRMQLESEIVQGTEESRKER
ncbi:hypothetical protein PYCCODRAFT_1378483 [Trametes coccinea BRFM310]|uniref:Saccharopine dehydrogenase NADP binding domain-containing protein n=1 Tax=Trametes coccinea (strain BRFM310) TaxID=1353009 RepID=A0A1Y2I6M7_TRAC3|nr:hypothetical protein PYCCODRAFT_1378483 [Trametes coccinea BRFM310]